MSISQSKDSSSILELSRKDSFLNYYRTYGDSIAGHYEDNGAVFVPYLPISFDLELFAGLRWPPEFKKVGSTNGLDQPVLLRSGQKLKAKSNHPLFVLTGGDAIMASYLQSQIATFNAQLTQGLQHLFPRYRFTPPVSISWRLTPTENEAAHLDVFGGGAVRSDEARRRHRLKVFVNLDTEPRYWRIYTDVPRALKALADRLPRRLPPDINVLNEVLNRTGLLATLPFHELRFPQMSAVIANGETLIHQVVYGRRMVAFETHCDVADMVDPAKLSHACVASWIREAGLDLDDDPDPTAGKYSSGSVLLD